ncbi:MAG: hypothetical protein OIN83_05835 [Candidatus Methanoperedens sp.]|nr:hypothetical protein [Candidatus Methanoperedens sp.]
MSSQTVVRLYFNGIILIGFGFHEITRLRAPSCPHSRPGLRQL